MRMILPLIAIGAAAYAFSRRSRGGSAETPAAFAEGQTQNGDNPVRDAGPDAMRDPPRADWEPVDQSSDESFPASDPPATY